MAYFECQGMSLWYGTPDAPAPTTSINAGQAPTVTVGVRPADASNQVEVLYSLNSGPTEVATATWLRNDVGAGAQYFLAQLPELRPGDRLAYVPVCRCAARQVPSPTEAAELPTLLRVSDHPATLASQVRLADQGISQAAPPDLDTALVSAKTGAAEARLGWPNEATAGVDAPTNPSLLGLDPNGAQQKGIIGAQQSHWPVTADPATKGTAVADFSVATSGPTPVPVRRRLAAPGDVALAGSLPADRQLDDDGEPYSKPATLFCPPFLRATYDTPAAPPFPIPPPLHSVSSSDGRTADDDPMRGAPGRTGPAGSARSLTRPRMDAGVPTAETPLSTFDTLADDLIAAAGATAVPLGGRAAADPFYDFDEYVFLQDGSAPPSLVNPYPDDPQLSRLAVLVDSNLYHWIGYSVMRLDPGWNFSPIHPATILHDWLMRAWTDACALDAVNHLSTYEIPSYANEDYLFGAYANFLEQTLTSDPTAKNLAALYIKTSDVSWVADLVGVSFWRSKSDAALATVNGALSWSQRGAEGPAADYPFTPFPTGKMLYGLRVIHRQTWRSLGYARGELVRTVPLSPKEIRRVSSKIVTRSKTTSTREEATSQERSSDTTSTTKDSSDVVSEASSKLNRHLDADVSGGVPLFFSAKITAGISDEQAASDKTSKARLNETMEKTASRMKRDTKVTVSTEGETTFEESTAIELTNPNDEVAVTYLYHRLQQPFWVATEIAEVHSVVLVPEPLPTWAEVNENWIRRYGDVIAAVLLDPTYAAILASIRSEPQTIPLPDTKVFGDVLSKAMTATDTYVAFSGGGAMQDLLGAGATAYDRDYERRAARAADEARRQHQTDGLVGHIRRNILHYMRAIWNSEDYDQRMQRLSRLRTATAWAFTPWRGLPENADSTQVDGLFLPLPGSIRPLTEIIDPAGPIGYLFNCAIYLLRDDNRTVNLNQALSHLRVVYTRFDVTVEPSSEAGVTVTSAVAEAPVHFDDRFTLLWRQARNQWLESRAGVAEDKWLEAPVRADGSLDWRGIRMWFTGPPTDGTTIEVHVQVTADLEDPHVRSLRIRQPLPPPGKDGAVFTEERLQDMAAMIPGLPPVPNWSELDEDSKARYRRAYHRYLALRETGRLVALDTANLVIDIETGASAALEPFKRLHRYLDVLKAQEEYHRGQLDNARREALLGAGRLGDPDIEHLTVVDPAAAAFAVLETDGDKPK